MPSNVPILQDNFFFFFLLQEPAIVQMQSLSKTINAILHTISIMLLNLCYPIPCSHPQTLTLVLNFLLRLISYSAKYKMIFAQVGILTMMINALKVYANELKEAHQQTGGCVLLHKLQVLFVGYCPANQKK